MDFAILVILDALANDECECANFGAIQAQALRCYGYVKHFIEKNPDFLQSVKGEMTMKKTELINSSIIQVLTATMSGVNSPHPQKVKADEVELIPWSILQEALSMTQSKPEIQGVTILGSTRKFAHGPMQRLIDDNEAKVFSWCAWEVMEPWPTDVVMQQKIKDALIRKFGDLEVLPKDLTQFSGYYQWKDFISKIRSLDVETLRTQWFCEKADSSGLVYPRFDEVLNVDTEFVLDKSKSIQIWEDFGYAKDHPDVVLLVQVDIEKMTWTVFDEMYNIENDTQDIIVKVIGKLAENGLLDEGLETDPAFLYKQIRYQQYFTQLNGWVPDYHDVTEIANRTRYGCPMWDKVRKEEHEQVGEIYKQENYIPLVRSFIDDRTGKLTPNVIKLRNEYLSYSKRKLIDGTYSDQAEKKNDHGPSACAFGCVRNWPTLAYQPFDTNPEQGAEIRIKLGGDDTIAPNTFTGGLMDKKF